MTLIFALLSGGGTTISGLPTGGGFNTPSPLSSFSDSFSPGFAGATPGGWGGTGCCGGLGAGVCGGRGIVGDGGLGVGSPCADAGPFSATDKKAAAANGA